MLPFLKSAAEDTKEATERVKEFQAAMESRGHRKEVDIDLEKAKESDELWKKREDYRKRLLVLDAKLAEAQDQVKLAQEKVAAIEDNRQKAKELADERRQRALDRAQGKAGGPEQGASGVLGGVGGFDRPQGTQTFDEYQQAIKDAAQAQKDVADAMEAQRDLVKDRAVLMRDAQDTEKRINEILDKELEKYDALTEAEDKRLKLRKLMAAASLDEAAAIAKRVAKEDAARAKSDRSFVQRVMGRLGQGQDDRVLSATLAGSTGVSEILSRAQQRGLTEGTPGEKEIVAAIEAQHKEDERRGRTLDSIRDVLKDREPWALLDVP